ncbi:MULTISPECIES: sigma-70 family RNA polymerase sigma factor [Methylomonas]|uniref:sigma-70 family RNA polymerase sigma factor n=1 Tax=Methylomonas TaxID=416 RepID=UPI000AA4756C|nr:MULTISPECIES: sigma-70 family RNA polymerase sigma factor [Methylomonas]ATG92292.1 RNA polymerase subunit sigma [Methylomonas koyamae]WNB75751.1 sigma-70 family RNA polymerase sigma factor [Methylomonas koyamae]
MTTQMIGNGAQDLTRLYQDHHPWLLKWLEKRVQDRLQAEDHAHDTFLSVIASNETSNLHEPRAYLVTIAKRLLINHWRRATIEQAYLERLAAYPERLAPSPEENAVILETLREIDDLLCQLPAKVRKAFLMAQLDGLTYAEIGRRLGVSDRMVRKYMAQAMLQCLLAGF